MAPARTAAVVGAALVLLAAPAVAGHSYGSCVPTPTDRCERWSATIDDPDTTAPARSDQFGAGLVATDRLVVAVAKDVALNTDHPYSSTSTALLRGYDRTDGHLVWTATYADRAYVNVTSAAASPDGSVIYITGGAYNGYPVGGATDSQLLTAAFRASDGTRLWSAHWDGRPDATDNGKAIAVSPDGSEVYVGGVTTSALGDLDFVTAGYSAADGHALWSSVYSGPKSGGSDAVFGLAVNPVRDLLYVTGWSDGVVEYDADYATVAYALGHGSPDSDGDPEGKGACKPPKGKGAGQDKDKGCPPPPVAGPAAGDQVWVARYDGVGQHKSDRANAVAVSPDGSKVYVTGDSFSGPGGGEYGYATVAYDATSGAQLWQARFAGGRGGFNSASHIVATATRVLVGGQASAPDATNGNDATTVGYDAATGRQLWTSSIAALRSDDFLRDLVLAPDGQTAYALASDTPLVNYTALTRMTVTAYSVLDGTARWTSELNAGALNALGGSALAVSPDGRSVAALGELKRSADPLGSRSQNVYDLVAVAFAA